MSSGPPALSSVRDAVMPSEGKAAEASDDYDAAEEKKDKGEDEAVAAANGQDDGRGEEPESDESDSDVRDVPDFLARAVAFYESRPFNATLDAFVRRHAPAFEGVPAEAKTDEDAEHSLEYSALHEAYLALVEEELGAFLASEGCDAAEFFSQCQDALDDKFVALFEVGSS